MVMSREQNAKQNNIKSGNNSFKNVEQSRYFGKPLTNKNSIHEEIKRRLKSGNACHYSVKNLISSRLLLKNIKAHRLIILFAVSYGCKILSPTLGEKCRLTVVNNRSLRKI
jgi:hypothetical protein